MFSPELLKKCWLVLILVVMTLAWFTLFKVKPTHIWNIQGIAIEGSSLFACIVGYLYITKLRIRNLNIGWALFTIGMLVHFLSQFINQPAIINVEVRGIIAIIGLVLIADGFYKAFTREKKRKEILKESERRCRTITDSSTSGIYIFQDGKFVFVNKAMEGLTGYKREKLLSMNYLDLIHPDYKDEMKRMTDQALTGNISGLPLRFEFKGIRKDGKERWVENTPTIIEYYGRPAILGNVRDITERKEMEEKLRKSEEKYRTLVETIQEGLGITDLEENFIFVNTAGSKILGYSRNELIGINLRGLTPPQDFEKILRERKKRRQGKSTQYEIKMWKKDGKLCNLRVSAAPFYDKNGKLIGSIATFQDITEQKQMEKRIKNLSALYREIGKAVNRSKSINGLCKRILKALNKVIDYDMGDILIYNPEEKTLTKSAQIGYPEELAKRTIKLQKVEEGQKGVARFSALHKKPIYIDNMKEDKRIRYVQDLVRKLELKEMYTVPLIARENLQGILQVVVKSGKTLSSQDRELIDAVSEEIAAGIAKIKTEEELRDLTIKDYLTGLYNHRYFYQKLGEEKGRSERYGEVYSLLYLDIDGFKACNDTYGHLEGDKVLRILGNILQSHLRKKVDSAYRYGGDEFVIMLPYLSKKEAQQVAARISKEIHHNLYPKYRITVSIGISDSKTSKNIVEAADKAMYEAKREGKGRIKIAL